MGFNVTYDFNCIPLVLLWGWCWCGKGWGGFSKCLSRWLRQIQVVALLVAVWPSSYLEGTTAISLIWTGFHLSSKLDGVAYLNELNKEMYCKEIL